MDQEIGKLRYEVLPKVSRGRRLVKLTTPFVYRMRHETFRLIAIVPKGFVSDLTSIPRALWPVLPPDGDYEEAAVIHDWMYGQKAIPRWLADAVFRHVMETTGVSWWRRCALFWGVRIGGWKCKK